MKLWLPAVFLLLSLMPPFHSDDSAGCPTCQELTGAPTTGIFVLVHDSEPTNRYLDIVAYYDNASASPRRQPLKDTILIVEITNATGLQVLRKTYTDQNGTALFNFNEWDEYCLNFKVLYCPFCVPPDSNCSGFQQCLNFSHIESPVTNADAIPDAGDANKPQLLNPEKYLSQVGTATWCPPPKPLKGTPEFCLPIILIFSLLCGALYLSGRNPFAGFNIGTVRPGQHIRYQARGRGWALNVTQMASTAVSLGQSIGTLAESPEKFAQQEASAIASRATMGMSQVHTVLGERKKSAGAEKSAKAGGKEGGKGGGKSAAGGAMAAGAGFSGGSGSGTPTQSGGPKSGMMAGGGIYGAKDVTGKLGEAGLFSKEGIKALPEALGRMAMFVVMSSSIGRVVDSAIYAATGKGLIGCVFDNRSVELADAKGLRAAMEKVPYIDAEGNEREATPKRETAIKDKEGNVIGRELVFEDPTGKSANGELTVKYDTKGNIEWTQLNIRGADGKTETYRVSAGAEGRFDVSKVDPATGAVISHLSGAEANNIAGIATNNAISDLTRPGGNANNFLEGDYALFKEARNSLDNKIASMQAQELEGKNDALKAQAENNPQDKEALDSLRSEYASHHVSDTLGFNEDSVKVLGGAEHVAATTNEAAEAGKVEVQPGVYLKLGDVGTSGGAAALTAGAGLSAEDQKSAGEKLSNILGKWHPGNEDMTQDRLQGELVKAGVSTDNAAAIAGAAAPTLENMAGAYRKSVMGSDLPDFGKGALAASTVNNIGSLSETGTMIEPKHTGDLMATGEGMLFMKDPTLFGPNYADTQFSNEFKAGAIEYERGLKVQSAIGESSKAGYTEETPSAEQKAAMNAGLAPFPSYDGKRPETKDFYNEHIKYQESIGYESDAMIAKTAFDNLPADKFPKEKQNEVIDALWVDPRKGPLESGSTPDRDRLKAAFGGMD